MGVLFPERTMQVEPTPFRHGSQRACITIFCRYLTDDVLALLRLAPHVREAEEVEGRPHRRRMPPIWTFEPEVYEAGLGWMELEPIPTKPLTEHLQQSLAGQVILESDHHVVSVADQLSPLGPRSRARTIHQHKVQVNVCEQGRDHTP